MGTPRRCAAAAATTAVRNRCRPVCPAPTIPTREAPAAPLAPCFAQPAHGHRARGC